jgi:hypothetical protein
MKSHLEGVWSLLSGQPLPDGVRYIKILSGGHFIFAAYDTKTGKVLYAAGGTYKTNGSRYVEHMDFASDKIPAGLVGRDQSFNVKVDGDKLTQEGTLSNGKPRLEVFERLS